jgi:hypothetical protein
MLEGKTDEDTWGKFVAQQCCHIHPLPYGEGKDKIMASLKMDLSEEMGVAGLVDADYWLITNSYELQTKNLVYDCCYPDSEMIVLNSLTLQDVLKDKLGTCDRKQKEVDEFAKKLRNQSVRLATEFGYFRLLNHIEDYGLHCNAIRFEDVIDCAALELDRVLIASKLSGDKPGLTGDDLLHQVDELRKRYPPDDLQLCRGKDVIAIMAHILPALYKSHFGEALPDGAREIFQEKRLAKELRKAYEYIYFKDTSLFGCIQNWESTNSPYKILKA